MRIFVVHTDRLIATILDRFVLSHESEIVGASIGGRGLVAICAYNTDVVTSRINPSLKYAHMGDNPGHKNPSLKYAHMAKADFSFDNTPNRSARKFRNTNCARVISGWG